MYSSGNIHVRNWVHLFESRCKIPRKPALLVELFHDEQTDTTKLIAFVLSQFCQRVYPQVACVHDIRAVSLKLHCMELTSCQLRSVTLHTAAVGTAWPLLCSLRNGQAVLYLFQKYLSCLQCIHSCSHCGLFLNGYKRLGHWFCHLKCLPLRPHYFQALSPAEGTDRLSPNVGKKVPPLAA